MLRTLLITIGILAGLHCYAKTSTNLFTLPTQMGEVQGTVTDMEDNRLEMVDVVAVKNGSEVSSAKTDPAGNYSLLLPPGTYTIYFIKHAFKTDTVDGFSISAGELKFLDRKMVVPGITLPILDFEYREPVVDVGGKDPIFKIKDVMLDKNPSNTALGALSTATGVYVRDDGEAPSLGQGRAYGTATFVDGQRYYGSMADLPKDAIEEISVNFTGVSAKYGDFTGGMIEITTRSF